MFNVRGPVVAEAFVNREAELEQLIRAIRSLEEGSAKWVAIIGPRRVGKSSLVAELDRRLPRRPFVQLDVQEVAPVSLEVFRRLALRAADALFAGTLGVSLEVLVRSPASYREAVARLVHASARPAEPDLLFALNHLAEEKRIDERWAADLLDLPERLARHAREKLVIAIDEFQELAQLARGTFDPFPLLRAKWQRHENVGYLISGSGKRLLEELVTSKHSPFFLHFEVMYLEPFTEDAALRLLVGQSPPERPITREVAKTIIRAIGRHPYYLQVFADTLTALPPPYDDAAIKHVLQEVLFSRTGRLGLYFENHFAALVGRSSYLEAALTAVAEGAARLTDISRAIGAPSGDTRRYLSRLEDAIVQGEDGRYAVADPLFAVWLRWREPGGSAVPMTMLGDAAERAVAAALARMGFDLVYQSLRSKGAFDLLATRGGTQVAIQVKGSALPLRFGKREWNRMSAEAGRFGWFWLVAAKDPEQTGASELSTEPLFLDPKAARIGREVRLTREAAIDNVLEWVDDRSRGAL